MGGGARPPFQAARPMLLPLLLLLVVVAAAEAAQNPALEQKCAEEVTKLMDCLAYAKGQAEEPTDKCCTSAGEMRGKDPACLCYVIQQTYEGTPTLKQLGLQLPRLVQLSAACKLPNSNVSGDCPKLLDIKPSSPEYAIFNGSVSSNSTGGPSSAGVMNQVQYTCAMASAIASAIVLSVFST